MSSQKGVLPGPYLPEKIWYSMPICTMCGTRNGELLQILQIPPVSICKACCDDITKASITHFTHSESDEYNNMRIISMDDLQQKHNDEMKIIQDEEDDGENYDQP